MKILVTGGAGFIGSNLALELDKQGHDVTVADNLFTGNRDNLNDFKGELIDIDVSKEKLSGKFDAIFHQAAITDPRFEDDNEMMRANIEGFKLIINLALENNAKLVYASSASVYGNGKTPMQEDQEKDPLNAYAKSKLMMDEMASGFSDKMHIVGLRYFNVFGPREAHKGRPASMIYHLAEQIKSTKKPRLFKFGEQKRDHIYVKDAVDAAIIALNAKKSGVYNVGTGIATTFNDIVKVLDEVFGVDFEPEYFDMPYKAGTYQSNTHADTELASKFLGFKARWGLKDAIKDYMNFLGWL